MATVNMQGKVFGFLTVIGLAEGRSHGQIRWKCQCECGNIHESAGAYLRQGKVKSCGCKKAELTSKANTRHGASPKWHRDPEYRIWSEMRRRCRRPESNRWHTHGARGIKVCERWEKYESFIADMGKRPNTELSIERRDNDGDYCPENCYWATRKEQARNKQNTIMLTVGGVTKPLVKWAEEVGIKRATIVARINAGWTPEDAVSKPLGHRAAQLANS